ncbi:hypothetical protein BUALT_Bualt04G0017300 [Buddleja alternifolia]|uniref:Uncharacterized protein n=1 Tax=Buddleja alternifolia TaxID=168488 RepID=A0AAV6XSD2_9LAMI|nr:hypothetical protein BUALT_Bualt04G0017300 [Buddleja alternifolia]
MADIAMLVAEEYERRVKKSRKIGEEIDLMSCVGVLGHDFKGLFSSSSSWIKEKEDKMVEEILLITTKLRVLKPKSQMSLAASYGFFSA